MLIGFISKIKNSFLKNLIKMAFVRFYKKDKFVDIKIKKYTNKSQLYIMHYIVETKSKMYLILKLLNIFQKLLIS